MSAITSALKNEGVKKVLRVTGVRKPAFTPAETTGHYRMPSLVNAGGHIKLKKYAGPEIPKEEWESLEYVTYSSDPFTFFAPLKSPNGKNQLLGAREAGKEDLDCTWTPNSEKCPTIVAWLNSIGANVGRVQLLRMKPNTLQECRWGLHQDNNNPENPDSKGWIVRIWLELTDDTSSALLVRPGEFARNAEVQIKLPKYQQAVVDSELLWHGGHHDSTEMRYALIASAESSPELEKWIASQSQ